MSLSLSTLEEVRRFEDLLELEEDGPPSQGVTLPEVQSLRLWQHQGHELHKVLEARAAPRRWEQCRRREERRKEAERLRLVAVDAELERQEERRRLAEWDAIFAIGAE